MGNIFSSARVEDILKAAMREILLPAWRRGKDLTAFEKTPGEIVTAADLDSQRFLEHELLALTPGARFLGEETTGSQPDDRSRSETATDRHEICWIVDPLDGTAGFVAGKTEFAVMAAFAHKGVIEGAWIVMPSQDGEEDNVNKGGNKGNKDGLCAARADPFGPAMLDSVPFQMSAPPVAAPLSGVLGLKYFDPASREALKKCAESLGSFKPPTSAGVDIIALGRGQTDYAIYNRTLPWDFAAPLYWGTRAGMISRRFSGAPICLGTESRGLVCARRKEDWLFLRREIIQKSLSERDDIDRPISEESIITLRRNDRPSA